MQNRGQYTTVNTGMLVKEGHMYRKLEQLISFERISYRLKKLSDEGYGKERIFKMMLAQYMEDLSDREMERYLQENVAAKYFCGFSLTDKTPDHSSFGKMRDRIGTSQLSKIFTIIRKQLIKEGHIGEVFTFVDASHLITKASLWKERDKAIEQKYEKLNNEVLPKVAHDKEARIGCKGKKKYWYGYKKHVSVDMKNGLINKVAITPANETDAQGLEKICPNQGAVVGDKGYCTDPAIKTIKKKGCHDATIKKDNMICKNRDKDRFLTKLRCPYESVFSQDNKRVRYKGVVKNQFAVTMNALVFNFKRLIVINAPPIAI